MPSWAEGGASMSVISLAGGFFFLIGAMYGNGVVALLGGIIFVLGLWSK